jgi:hypothetical protein
MNLQQFFKYELEMTERRRERIEKSRQTRLKTYGLPDNIGVKRK